jgi:hypothetical protein
MTTRLRALPILSLIGLTAHAADLSPVRFNHKDWEIACDNTRTCRAAGYQVDEAPSGASVLLTRAAGPNAPVQAEVQFAPADEVPARVQMQIDDGPLGEVRIENAGGRLNETQTAALLSAVLKNSKISWSAKARAWKISTAGANAVLLKMDELQGRVGTPGALVHQGSKPETSVLPPLAAPAILVPKLAWSAPDQQLIPAKLRAGLLAELRKTVTGKDGSDCEALDDKDAADHLTIWRLTKRHLLISAECWRGAYNIGEGYWVVNARPPYSPALVTTDASGYSEGQIKAYQRGRGVGDCGSSDTWTFDGGKFVHTETATSGLCKGFAGGAWHLPTLVVKVNSAK